MRLISEVRVRNFRSLREVGFEELAEYSPIIGTNGSGKSNLFRALSLFFNGRLDEVQTPLDLARDFPDIAKKERHTISVTVTFDFGADYDARGARGTLAASGIADELVIERSWSYAPGGTGVVESLRFGQDAASLRLPDPTEAGAVQILIRSVEFRYIPNHVRPAELIRSEIAPLQQALMSRLRKSKAYKGGKLEEIMAALKRVGDDTFGSLSTDVARGTRQLRGVGADVPKDFSALAFRLGVNAISSTGKVQAPEVQGSGTQTFILLHVLALLDANLRGQGFGWRQSSVWAFEEPESFLHAGLRLRFAEDLRRFAEDPRRQILLTTHHDEFVRLADHAWLCDLVDGATHVARETSREALIRSNRQLVTTFVHPLLLHPREPLVLVEGSSDAAYLRAALIASGRRPRWRLVATEDLELGRAGGDAVLTWLKGNSAALRSRPEAAPVFVLRDWEDTKGGQFDHALRPHEWSRSFTCPIAGTNPELDDSFRGIERYLSTDFVRTFAGAGLLSPAGGAVPLSLRPSDRDNVKQRLVREFVARSADAGPHLIKLAEWVDDQIEGAISKIPTRAFTDI